MNTGRSKLKQPISAFLITPILHLFHPVSVNLVDSAARDCFFGPPPKPEAGHSDPRHWMEQVMEEVRENCPGRQRTTPAEQPTTMDTGKQTVVSVVTLPET